MTAITQPRMILYHPRRGFRGLGQSEVPSSLPGTDITPTYNPGADVQEGGTYVPPSGPNPTQIFFPSTSWPSASSGGGTYAPTTSNWLNILGTAIQTAGKTAQVALSPLSALPAGSYYQNTPYGTVVATGGGGASSALLSSTLTSTLSSMLPILLIGGAVVLVIMMAKK